MTDPAGARAPLWAWLREEQAAATPATRADDARLEEVRRLRKESFAAHGGGDERRQLVPGRSWAAWSRALGLLLPPLDVADLGCGEGLLTIETARWARKVDRRRSIARRARARAARWPSAASSTNITWKRGDLERVPITDASVDVALLSQALHHAEHPAARWPRRGGSCGPAAACWCSTCAQHEETWVRGKLGDRWLGFSDEQLRRACSTAAGFARRRRARRRAARPAIRSRC